MICKKVIITGTAGSGKTSLLSWLVGGEEPANLPFTLGLLSEKRFLHLESEKFCLVFWDIQGGLKDKKVPKSYFVGGELVLYVNDLSQADTWKQYEEDRALIKAYLPGSKVFRVGNKIDLVNVTSTKFPVQFDVLTNALTGENIDKLLNLLQQPSSISGK